MELWEFNACVEAYNKQKEAQSKEQTAKCWQTGYFAGAAFVGKLKPLRNYIKEKSAAPKVSKDEFERRLKLAEGRALDGS